ncbi:MAG: hypothetical protein AABX85_01880 [Nanoarchaeota archaeon]
MNPLEIKVSEELKHPTDPVAERLEEQEHLYHTFQEGGRPFWDMYPIREEEYRLPG